MKYYVVEKDIEEEIGFLHTDVIYDSKKEAMEWVKKLQDSLGEYYNVFVVESER